jgi:hypothetical protein
MRKVTMVSLAFGVYIALVAAPGAAVALSPVITHPTGTPLSVNIKGGVGFKATNVGVTKLTLPTGGAVECSTASMTGAITINSEGRIEADVEAVSFSGTSTELACTGSLPVARVTVPSVPWCIKAGVGLPTDGFEIRGGKCTEPSRSVTFIIDTGLSQCKYEKASVSGTITTDTQGQDAALDIAESEFKGETGNPPTCPSSGKLDMTYTLETDSGAAEPLYFS